MNFLKCIFFGPLLFLAACSVSDGNGNIDVNAKSESFTYSFESNGCKTGEHSFGSLVDMCNGLQNEELNNGCAQWMRRGHYKENCTNQGDFVPN